jgi:hypothetical protein
MQVFDVQFTDLQRQLLVLDRRLRADANGVLDLRNVDLSILDSSFDVTRLLASLVGGPRRTLVIFSRWFAPISSLLQI